jgi:hypothetical protein
MQQSPLVPVEPSTEYTFELAAYGGDAVASQFDVEAALFFFDAADDVIGGADLGGPVPALEADWIHPFVTATSPSNAAYALAQVTVSAASVLNGARIDLDAAIIHEGSTTGIYFDGSTLSDEGNGVTYAWTGIAHTSPSVRIPFPLPPIAGDPTSPPEPGLDVLQLLGDEIAVVSTFTYPPEDVYGDGDDGNYWLDTDGHALYGPKARGTWPETPAITGTGS